MIIVDFNQVEALIPEDGSLSLAFSKNKKGDIIVAFAPKYPNKDTKQELRPITLQGTPEELNNSWAAIILEIVELENKVAAGDVVTTRKAELTKAVTKSTGAKPATAAKKTTATKSTSAAKTVTETEKANPDGLLFETSAGPIGNPDGPEVEEKDGESSNKHETELEEAAV